MKEVAVQAVGARPGDGHHDGTGLSAVLGPVGARHDLKLAQRFHTQHHPGCAAGCEVGLVVDVSPVNQEEVRVRARAEGGELYARAVLQVWSRIRIEDYARL